MARPAPGHRSAVADLRRGGRLFLGAERPLQGRLDDAHYGRPGKGVHAIQMELAQSPTCRRTPPWSYDEKAAPLRPALRRPLKRAETLIRHRQEARNDQSDRKNTRDRLSAHGPELNAKSWLTEAPLRMLMNNLHPDVAENPHELVVYGGIGRAARTWEDFDRSSPA
jgi:hypothetical protein